ncbi:MAG: alpha/beta fold hydrolase BchO [Myxococcota bacterium]
MNPPGEAAGAPRVLAAGGLRWTLRDAGSGPLLLALHGTGASGHSFDALTPWLSDRFRVLTPDLPGHAGTERPRDLSLAGMARALGRLLAETGCAPQVVLGHSAGAAIGLELTRLGLAQPRQLVGLAAALMPFRGVARAVFPLAAELLARPTFARAIAGRFRRTGVGDVLRGTGSEHLDEASRARYGALAADTAHVGAVLGMLAAWDLEPLWGSLGQLDLDVLLLAGARDRAVPLAQQRAAAARLPRARLLQLPGAGHLLHEERPDRVGALLRASMAAPFAGA